MPVLAMLGVLADVLSGQGGALPALAALAIAGLLAVAVSAAVRAPGPSSPAGVRTALRVSVAVTGYLRLRDPAAPGRPLSRAPSA
ncbi:MULTISPECIES: DUF6412 domain-containing protein [Thermomonospora]|uniref:Uncharacterized protein n=1 Tax=Thermomonospora cellulosilytica TaxID=1411118 RepID=A0A7W3MZ50_9ACTN|nr:MULTISPECIES: DUF6412 domain-containing protein [Thermomonospora]MBA9004541.1 hypothetical protein [Thermomonospora cellulosilytica]